MIKKNTGKEAKSYLQLKADLLPITVLHIMHHDLDAIIRQLNQSISKAPNYLSHAPIIIDINSLESDQHKQLNLDKLCQKLREKKIIPIGIRGLSEKDQENALQNGLVFLKNDKSGNTHESHKKTTANATEAPQKTTSTNEKLGSSKIIIKPVRSGTRVYAKDSDLVIMAPVNPGAECIADGNIHVYAPLRGRALAGANGNTEARIFCKSLEAELIAIAGQYLVNEDIVVPKKGYALIQIYLENGKIKIEGV